MAEEILIKNPKLIIGEGAKVEAEVVGENDIVVVTDEEFYTKEEINSLLGEGTTFEVQVVNSLPATGAKGVIYLVPKDGAAPDVHDEYVWIESTSTFELIGTTQIDLTGYVKNTDYASVNTGGVIKSSTYYGTAVQGDGKMYCVYWTLDQYKTADRSAFIGRGTLENAKNDIVKRAITENDIVLTDEEKTAALTWLGVVGKYVTQNEFADAVNSITLDMGNKVNVSQGAENAGKILKVDDAGNVVVGEGGGASLPILLPMWSDRVINDMSWLRADTFSWHSGDVYVAAYQHLVAEQNGTRYYAWVRTFDSRVYYTTVETPEIHDVLYTKNTDGEFLVYDDVWEGGSESITNSSGDELVRDSSKDETALQKQTDTIGDTTITYYQADDGHKICSPDQESNLVALYEATGVAWYYVLDTENKRFKLPRTKWGFTGLRDSVGGYIAPGLPNISGTFMAAAFNYTTGHVYDNLSGAFSVINAANAAYGGGGGANNSLAHFQFNASKSNEIYGASDTVQPPATQMYLYFYVGNFEQSAIEQTAGITSETLNQKADIDGGNCSANFAKFGMPSEIYTNLTLGSSGSRYTAPADGWFALGKTGGSGQMINMENQLDGSSSQTMGSRIYSAASSVELKIYLPARKGDVVYVSYTASGTTNFFRFIYAEGAKHLA